ncbi:MAG: nucleotide-binding domain containing protein, partial [Bacteroidota bacterium]
EIASRYFKTGFIPLVIGAPFLNRFVVFGNLFARVGEDTFRLDRHPTMSKHPVTPMNESDLRRHLGLQTERKVQLMDLFALEGEYGKVDEYFDQLTTTEGDFVLFDTLTRDHMMVVGELLLEKNIGDTQFLVGASGMNHAMAFCLQQRGLITPPQIPKSIGAAQHMVVITGSCAPGTATQVGYMKQRGHEAFKIDTGALVNQESSGSEVENCVSRALHAIERGSTPVLYAALGPDDPSIGETEQAAARLNVRAGELIAERQGQMAFEIANKVPHLRVGIAGGDTSGYVSRALGIYALEAKCPIAPGAPLCVAHSRNPQFDGMEITLKGGQNGNEKFFEYVLRGQVHD